MGLRDVSPAYYPSYFAMYYEYRFIHSFFLNLTSFQKLVYDYNLCAGS